MSTGTAIGFDMGATSTKTGVVNNGKILTRGYVIETRQDGNTAALIDSFIHEIQRLQQIHPEVEAVGFGVPGIINPVQGAVVNLTNVKGWSNIPLRSIIMERTRLVGNLENDAKAMAYAEWKHGAGQSVPNVVCVTLGTAVGGALILNGRLYRGATYVAGEIGQTSIDYNGVDFVYGNKGALEAYVGHRQISAFAKELYKQHGRNLSDDEAHLDHLSKAADEGDTVADDVWRAVGLKIGVGLTNVIWLVNPDRIVIGGGVANAGERLFRYIRQTIQSRCEKTFWKNLDIVPATLGNDAGIIGAASLALESEFLPK
ncbi:MAG TPA: ROK family protein [Chthoniobacterales bacterium]|nr:ROK family protein [Chthoniobacterales bacterium]